MKSNFDEKASREEKVSCYRRTMTTILLFCSFSTTTFDNSFDPSNNCKIERFNLISLISLLEFEYQKFISHNHRILGQF